MKGYTVISGTYGLQVDLLVEINDLSDCFVRKTTMFLNSEMFGNSYNFQVPSTQAKIFKLPKLEGMIKGIEISLVQGNNFYDSSGAITYSKILNNDTNIEETIYPLFNHIIVSNLEVGIGSNLVDIEDNILEIYSPDS